MPAFAGSSAVTPAVLPGPQSVNLSGASIPAPTSSAWALVGASSAGAKVAVLPGVATAPRAGVRAPGHDGQWFDRIHVVPRKKDLEFVLSEQAVLVEVWNAFMSESKVLTAITLTGPAGIAVDNPDTLPVVFPGSRSKTYTVRALATGDPTIDNSVTWVFTGISSSGTNLLLVGARLLPWPFPANLEQAIAESVAYLTDVMQSWDETEQRVQLRELPRRGLEFAVLLHDARDAQHANALLHGWQPRTFGVPFWQYANRLTGAVAIDATVIPVDTTDVLWSEIDTVFLWTDPYTWEALSVASVTPTQINLASPARKAWAAAVTLAMPLGVGRLPEKLPFTWEDLRIGTARLPFDLENVS